MRVLMVVRPNVTQRFGGDAVLAQRSAAALRARGVEVDVAATLAPDAAGYDVAHLYGIFDPDIAEPQIEALRRSDVPLVVSPVWWDRTALFRLAPLVARALLGRRPTSVERQLARLRRNEAELVRKPGRGALRFRARQAALLRRADVAFTGSFIEAFACARFLGVDSLPYVVAPYGLGDEAFGETPGAVRSGVVCVGRIEPLKNQALLLFALRDLDVDVTLVGGSYDADYGRLCRRLATARTHFVEGLPNDELAALLGRTAVHVLPSWGDLPGFVSLEAAARGARVVAGARGSEREYLGPDATYVDPLDPAAIREAVVRALGRPPRSRGDALDERLRALRWETYAERSLDAYARAIDA
ncbi:MAG: glycosyltransferase [Vulcanimicrobiaceae bacterium]